MKKLILLISLCLSFCVAYPAMVIFRWNPDNAPLFNGSSPVAIRLYYGSQLKTYTNSVTTIITTNKSSTSYVGYDQYNCVTNVMVNYINISIYGLVLSNQIYTAYSFIYPGGHESPLINEAKCGFIIMNENDKPVPPYDLRIH